jgi:hypothetical protein
VCRELDDVFDIIGFGNLQILLYVVCSCIQIPSAMLNTGIAFMASDPAWECAAAVGLFFCFVFFVIWLGIAEQYLPMRSN